jgi:putative PIN family toxin of toxin-antitoxin system
MVIVFDNNVLISAALLKGSIPFLALKKALKNHTILRSFATLDELRGTIFKPKFDKYFVDNSIRDKFVLSYIASSVNIEVVHEVHECRDPKDNMYLELALSGKADVIITGDVDLLTLHPFSNTLIVTPKEFIENY